MDNTSSNLHYPTLSANASGYISSYYGVNTSYSTARIKTRSKGSTASWSSSYALMAEASCTARAADTTYAVLCDGSTVYLSADGSSWGSAKPAGSGAAIAPAEGGRFRVVAGTNVYNSTGTTWDTATGTVPGLLTPIALASDRKAWFLLGKTTDGGYDSIRAYDTSGTSFQDRGLFETNPGATYTPSMNGALGVVGAVWPQDVTTSTPAIFGSLF
jgi:hypothetical protein